jgi:hypothetical protein
MDILGLHKFDPLNLNSRLEGDKAVESISRGGRRARREIHI